MDNFFPYPSSTINEALTAQDSPGIAVIPPYTGYSRALTAQMFLMWQSSLALSIPVPLGSVTWSMSGAATQNATTHVWSLNEGATGTAGPFVLSTAPKQANYGFPTWGSVAINNQCTLTSD